LYDLIEVLLRRSHSERWAASLSNITGAFNKIIRAHEALYEAIADGNEALAEKKVKRAFQNFWNKETFFEFFFLTISIFFIIGKTYV